ncbi:TldD/PmbA family protein [candidate division WOR-3 bacterium]|nr:TldD/PmbA family protein [candidate division WOR-3 bacterium]
MENLMAFAKKESDQVELYSLEQTANRIEFEAAKLNDIQSTIESGVTMRLIKDHKLGFAYTRNLQDGESLVRNALASLKGGVEARFDFPASVNPPGIRAYDERIKEARNTVIVDECRRIYSRLEGKTKGQIDVTALTGANRIGIMNSAGADLSAMNSYYSITVNILYPGTATGIHRTLVSKAFQSVDDGFLEGIVELYNSGAKELNVRGGKMPAVFMPESMYALIWRLQSATSGESLYHKQSPLAGRLGETIFEEKLTIVNDPLDDTKPGARIFDDEGVTCTKFPIIDRGVLKNFYYDLCYASKMGTAPTGHGFKTSRWSGETISMRPSCALEHLTIEPGDTEFWQLVRSVERGIIVCGTLGAHSGNIPNGDFSIGLSPGLFVEKGAIVGRIKDAMIAGNIYEVLKRVRGIENRVHPAYTGYYPAVLFDDISVATEN